MVRLRLDAVEVAKNSKQGNGTYTIASHKLIVYMLRGGWARLQWKLCWSLSQAP